MIIVSLRLKYRCIVWGVGEKRLSYVKLAMKEKSSDEWDVQGIPLESII